MQLNIGEILLQYVCLLFSLCVHEAGHAAMADRCGDPSARFLGRMTLNPLKHIDPMGTVILPLLMMVTSFPYMFGWAKPVPFNPRNLHNMRRDPMLISLAGPGSNFLIALVSALLLRIIAVLLGTSPDMPILHILAMILLFLMVINILLMLFNLLPLPPLDGHHILGYFLPPSGQRMLEQIGPFGILIAIVLVSQLGILHVPMKLISTGLMFVAFYGTPVWGTDLSL